MAPMKKVKKRPGRRSITKQSQWLRIQSDCITRLTLDNGRHRWSWLHLLDLAVHDCAHFSAHQLFPGREIVIAEFTTGSVAPRLRQPANVALRKPVRGSVACQKIVDVSPDLDGRVLYSGEWHRSIRYCDGSFSKVVLGRDVECRGGLGLRGVLRGERLVCWWLLHVYLVVSPRAGDGYFPMVDVESRGKRKWRMKKRVRMTEMSNRSGDGMWLCRQPHERDDDGAAQPPKKEFPAKV